MPFDPDQPAQNSPNSSAVMRAQLNGLNDKIDAGAILTVVFDSIVMLPPGEAPAGSASLVGNVLHLSLSIPVGATGAPGADGTNGTDGAPGATGPMGEVTTGQLNAAIEGTARNPINVALLSTSTGDPVLLEHEAKINELINATKRV